MRYNTIQGLKSIDTFAKSIKKLYIDELNDGKTILAQDEIVYLYGVALLLLKTYSLDHSYRSHAEMAYAIILKLSLLTNDFRALHDFSLNFGFYPISSMLVRDGLIEVSSIRDELSNRYMNSKFSYKDIIETYEQKELRDLITEDYGTREFSLIAPTSYGKSSLIAEDISVNSPTEKRVAIIVPTKSLLSQTYRMIKASFPDQKIILHDEMYMQDDKFIAILTQERALRLLLKAPLLSFDKLYIDEAHNLFDKDPRMVTLARVIKLNRKRDTVSKIVYLSPLISDSDNLRYSPDQDIIEQRIDFSMKEPVYDLLSQQNEAYRYNRFNDEFYSLERQYDDYIDYIKETSKSKNFIYHYSPRRIEEFTMLLANSSEAVNDIAIREVIEVLSDSVHEDFFAIDYLKKGIVYLHARMPDNIKEYLEYKFTSIKSIKYLVANKVVLEGINLPVDSLYIMNTFNLSNKDLTNLVGRVNRLNMIFSKPGHPELLMPSIHFVNTERFNRKGGKMERSISSLRKGIEADEVKNPLLYEFDVSQYHPERDIAKIKDAQKIIDEETVLESADDSPVASLKRSMIESGLGTMYHITPLLCETLYSRLSSSHDAKNLIDLIYDIFIKDLGEFITDYEYGRLSREGTRKYYQDYIDAVHEKSFKYLVNRQVAGFIARVNNPELEKVVYLGDRLGEISRGNGKKNLYVDLSVKSRVELVNLAIAKLKIENDFINYKLLNVIQLLLNYEIISEHDYHLVAYGTSSDRKINLIRLGLSLRIINKIESDEQLNNLVVSPNNTIITNDSFMKYMSSLDDLMRFELRKIL